MGKMVREKSFVGKGRDHLAPTRPSALKIKASPRRRKNMSENVKPLVDITNGNI